MIAQTVEARLHLMVLEKQYLNNTVVDYHQVSCPPALASEFINLASTTLDNRFLCLKDERFVDDLLTDLSDYLQRNDSYRVLLFPPLNGYNRLLIHKTVESEFSDLITFSIGTGVSRRTVVAFRIACCRGPRGIQMMNSPGSPMSRGRGRGRQKEMSSSERVTHWVNQREARRLNKERWANRVPGDERHEDDSQLLAKQETEELESGYVAKRHNVQLYVPPSLRAKKESETKNDSFDLEVDNSSCKKIDNEDVCKKSETAYKTEVSEQNVFKSDCEDQQQTCELSRTRQRGRGRRKPEVEIYVPRALRTAKHESKSISEIQTGNDIQSLNIETHEKTDLVHCNEKLDTNILASQSSPQTQSIQSEQWHNYISQRDILHQNIPLQPYSKNELNMHCDINGSQAIVTHDLATKKVKYELTVGSGLPSTTSATASTAMKTTSNEESHLEDVRNSLTFEFYDPAVIAFLPSSQHVQEPFDTNNSYSKEISRHCVFNLEDSYPMDEHVFESSPQPVATDTHSQVQHGTNECESVVSPIHDDAGYNVLITHKEADEECSHGKINTVDVNLNQKGEHFILEQTSVTISSKSSEMEDNNKISSSTEQDGNESSNTVQDKIELSTVQDGNESSSTVQDGNESSSTVQDGNESSSTVQDGNESSSTVQDKIESSTVQDDSLKAEISATSISMSVCSANIDLSEDSMTGRTDLNISGLSQKDISFIATDISMSGCSTDVNFNEDLMAGRIDLSVSGLSQKNISSTIQQATESSSVDQLVPQDGADKQFINSKMNETDVRQTYQVSRDLVQEEVDTWDSLFDDNGDCLDDALITELEEYVGKVEIDKPRINYLNYEPKEPEMDFQGFSHILEIYDFSPDLATCDLISAFREFSSRGFDVKWVDDTHALGIFSSSVAANEALKMIHPLLKLRPLSEASKKGQSKARHCQEFLQPYKARPETTSIAARRLVAGALGMSTQVSREVREREKQKLKEAKAKRRQERQQKVDIWDGSFGKCAMDDD